MEGEPRRLSISVEEDSAISNLTQLQDPSPMAIVGSANASGVQDRMTDDSALAVGQDSDNVTRPGDSNTEMRESVEESAASSLEGSNDVSMIDVHAEEQITSADNDRTETGALTSAADREIDTDMQHMGLQSGVSTPDRSDRRVSLHEVPKQVPVLVPKVIESVDQKSRGPPETGGSLLNTGISPGPSASREDSAVSVSSSATRSYTIDDVEFLVSGAPADGPRTMEVHPSVRQALNVAVTEWQKKGRSKGAWSRASDVLRCVET